MLQRVPGLVAGHADGGQGGSAVNIGREPENAAGRIVVVGQESLSLLHCNVVQALTVEQGAGGLGAGHTGGGFDLGIAGEAGFGQHRRVERQ